MTDRLLTTTETAEYLGIEPRTLERWRFSPPPGGAPPYIRIHARCVRYRMADLLEWLEERTYQHTSAEGE